MAADLVVIEASPPPGLEEMVLQILEQVRAGEISSAAVAWIYRDGRIGTQWSEAPSFAALLGASCRLTHDMQIGQDGADDAAAG